MVVARRSKGGHGRSSGPAGHVALPSFLASLPALKGGSSGARGSLGRSPAERFVNVNIEAVPFRAVENGAAGCPAFRNAVDGGRGNRDGDTHPEALKNVAPRADSEAYFRAHV